MSLTKITILSFLGFTVTLLIILATSYLFPPQHLVEEKTKFNVMLASYPADKKVGVIKVIRAITGLGLKEAKDLVEGVPSMVKEAVSKDEAAKIKKELEESGATVDVK